MNKTFFVLFILGSIFYIVLVCVISMAVNAGRFLEFRSWREDAKVTHTASIDTLKCQKVSALLSNVSHTNTSEPTLVQNVASALLSNHSLMADVTMKK